MNCKNKKIISMLIASGILLSPNNAQAMESMVDLIKENKEILVRDTNIVVGSVYEVEIGEGEFVPDLTNNPQGYETIKVKTTGNKKLVAQDYINLRYSRIPKIDLSSAQSDSIPDRVFYASSALKEFKFPQGLTSIGDEAFMTCSNLSGKLELPDTLKSIGNHSFYCCSSLSGNLELPNSLTSIGSNAFVSCVGFSGDLVIPDSVTTIGDNAFTYCDGFNGNLKLSNSLKSIGANAFVALKGLSGDLIIPDSVEFIGEAAFSDCIGFSGDLILPNSLKNLSDGVFAGCTGFNGTLKLPDNLETIGFATFNGCDGFKGELVIPNSVKTIGNRAFGYCTGFSGDLIIPDSVTTIGTYSFNGCKGLNGILKLSDSLTDIGIGAFYKCSGLSGELTLPNSITNIGMYAFNECSGFTGNLVIPNSLATLGNNAFRNTNLDKIFIKVNSEDKVTDYRKSIIDALPTESKIIIDTPYDFDISKTWLENTDKVIAKPVVKNVVNGVESELVDGKGEKVSLYIPSIYEESNITVLKDGKSFNLPIKNNDDKYIFTEEGNYEVRIKTSLGNVSVMNFEVNNEVINIDKESPKIDYKLSTEDLTNENVTITVNASDNVGIEKIILPNNSEVNASSTTYEVSQNGAYEFIAVDKSGNRKNIIVKVNNIDKESPKIDYKLSTDDWTNENVTITINASDNVDIEKIILPNNSEVNASSTTYEVSQNGDYEFTAVDKSGNRENIIVKVNNIDKESPLVSYKIIKDNEDSVIVEFEMKDSLSGINSIINDKGLTSLDGNKFELMKNVQYTFTVTDNAGNTNTINILEEKQEDNLIESLPKIEGLEFVQGNGTESNPLEILIQEKEAIDELVSKIESSFEYNIVGEPYIKDGYKIYKVKLNNKTVVANEQVKSNGNSSYIEIKVNKDNTNLINKLDKIFIKNNDSNNGGDSNEGDVISPVPPTIEKPEIPSVPPTQKPVEFNDIKDHWAEETIKEFTDKNFINGYEDNTFKPDNSMTRAEFVKVVNKVFGYTQKGEEQFTDVNTDDWFYNDICIGIKAGYIKGKSTDRFAPNDNITREEVAMILTNIMKNKDDKLDKLNTFRDGDKTSQWAQSSVEGAIEAGYLKGYEDKTIRSNGNITRAEAISMLSRVN